MSKLIINGGKSLFGEFETPSSKNSFLPILAGCILATEEVVLHKYPNYLDINSMCDILKYLGSKVEKQGSTLVVNSKNIEKCDVPSHLACLVRSSIFTLGAILARFKKTKIAYPGGCEIGARPIDIHLAGLKKLGVKITERHGYINCDGSCMKASDIMLDFPSVGATESLIMASVLLNGTTKIYNCAKEPEVVDLQNFLNKMGAKIQGAGTDKIVINGVKNLKGCEYTPISDRIIAGTVIIGTCMCQGEVFLKNINPLHIQSLLTKIDGFACQIESKHDTIKISCSQPPKALTKIETSTFPGFPTDLQSQILSLQTISEGSCLIVENLFENRFKNVPELIKMGADIQVKDRIAVVKGVKNLFGAEVLGGDLRGTASLVLAGLCAKGYTTVNNVHHVDRGYENIEKQFASLGADIKRIK